MLQTCFAKSEMTITDAALVNLNREMLKKI